MCCFFVDSYVYKISLKQDFIYQYLCVPHRRRNYYSSLTRDQLMIMWERHIRGLRDLQVLILMSSHTGAPSGQVHIADLQVAATGMWTAWFMLSWHSAHNLPRSYGLLFRRT